MKCFLNPNDFSMHDVIFTKNEREKENENANENKNEEKYHLSYCNHLFHLNCLPLITEDVNKIATIEHLILDFFVKHFLPKNSKKVIHYAIANEIITQLHRIIFKLELKSIIINEQICCIEFFIN